MNIDQIQKINEMALNLMRQGLATSHDEAVAQAEKFYKGDGASDYASIRDRMREPTTVSTSNTDSNSSELSHDKIKEILETNSAFLVKTITEFREKIAAMEKEISDMKLRNNYMSQSQAQQQAQQQSQQQSPQQTQQQPSKLGEVFGSNPIPRGQDTRTESHPRQGSFKSEDVSIEKFFYMGRK